MNLITADHFRRSTGQEPQDDDLDRCNCLHAGEIGHGYCGWSSFWNRPNFMLKLSEVNRERQK